MKEVDLPDMLSKVKTEIHPEDVHGWNTEDASAFKLRETARAKQRWEGLLQYHADIYRTLVEVDSILATHSQSLTGHISGSSFETITHNTDSDPDTIVIRLVHDIEHLQSIENHFFKNISEDRRAWIEGTPITIEVGDPYKETVELDTDFERFELQMPTMQSFYNLQISEGIEARQ